jgi:hypothetical protein
LLDGEFSTRRLREFIPRDGTELAEQQKEFMKQVKKEEMERRKEEEEMITKMQELGSESRERHGNDDSGLGGITEIELDGNGQGFFYDKDMPEEVEEGDSIADRVLRRRGRRHFGEGHME